MHKEHYQLHSKAVLLRGCFRDQYFMWGKEMELKLKKAQRGQTHGNVEPQLHSFDCHWGLRPLFQGL